MSHIEIQKTSQNIMNDLDKLILDLSEKYTNPITEPIIKKRIALCSTKDSIYDDISLGQNKYGYCADLDSKNEAKICLGAHYYERKKACPFIYKGIVSNIERNNDMYILTLIKIPSLGMIEADTEVPKVTPGGRGSYRYMYDVCKCSDIKHLNTSPTRGILYGT